MQLHLTAHHRRSISPRRPPPVEVQFASAVETQFAELGLEVLSLSRDSWTGDVRVEVASTPGREATGVAIGAVEETMRASHLAGAVTVNGVSLALAFS